jgi:hypothetical protein
VSRATTARDERHLRIPSRKPRRSGQAESQYLRCASQLRMSHEGFQLVGYHSRVDAGRGSVPRRSLPSHHLNEHAKDVVWAVTHYQTAGRLETTAACKIIGPLPSCGFGSWQGAFARWQKTSNRSAM